MLVKKLGKKILKCSLNVCKNVDDICRTRLVFLRRQYPLISLMSRVSVTGESPPSLSKELTNSLAGVGDVSFDADSQFPLDELKIDPLTLDGLHMLNDPDMVLADPATEDTFRMDRL